MTEKSQGTAEERFKSPVECPTPENIKHFANLMAERVPNDSWIHSYSERLTAIADNLEKKNMERAKKLGWISLQIEKGLKILYEHKAADLDAVNLFTLVQSNLNKLAALEGEGK